MMLFKSSCINLQPWTLFSPRLASYSLFDILISERHLSLPISKTKP